MFDCLVPLYPAADTHLGTAHPMFGNLECDAAADVRAWPFLSSMRRSILEWLDGIRPSILEWLDGIIFASHAVFRVVFRAIFQANLARVAAEAVRSITVVLELAVSISTVPTLHQKSTLSRRSRTW